MVISKDKIDSLNNTLRPYTSGIEEINKQSLSKERETKKKKYGIHI